MPGLGEIELSARDFIDEGLTRDFGQKEPKEGKDLAFATGAPDEKDYVIGKGGTATWKFTDNALVDREGPDLLVWQSDGAETFEVWVSPKGFGFQIIGEFSGNGIVAVDLNGKFDPGEELRFVRIVDTSLESNAWPGPDIDAIAAVPVPWSDGGASSMPVDGGSDALEYTTAEGEEIRLALGGAAFADEAVTHDFGNRGPKENATDPDNAVGPPDYDDDDSEGPTYFSLGDGGSAVWKFVDNSLVNGPGDDLLLFEIGGYREPVLVEVSVDGDQWLRAGEHGGEVRSIDLGSEVPSGTEFFYVRLTDSGGAGGDWPGADIDSIAAVHGTPRGGAAGGKGSAGPGSGKDQGSGGGSEGSGSGPGHMAGGSGNAAASLTGAIIENRLEANDDGYAGGEYRNDVYLVEVGPGDILGVRMKTDGFVPEVLADLSGRTIGRSDGLKEDPDDEISFVTSPVTSSGTVKLQVMSEHKFSSIEDRDNVYQLQVILNGRFLSAPATITAAGGEGSVEVPLNFESDGASGGGGGNQMSGTGNGGSGAGSGTGSGPGGPGGNAGGHALDEISSWDGLDLTPLPVGTLRGAITSQDQRRPLGEFADYYLLDFGDVDPRTVQQATVVVRSQTDRRGVDGIEPRLELFARPGKLPFHDSKAQDGKIQHDAEGMRTSASLFPLNAPESTTGWVAAVSSANNDNLGQYSVTFALGGAPAPPKRVGARVTFTSLSVEDSPSRGSGEDRFFIRSKLIGRRSAETYRFPEADGYHFASGSGDAWMARPAAFNLSPRPVQAPTIEVPGLKEGEIAFLQFQIEAAAKQNVPLVGAGLAASSSWKPSIPIGLPDWDERLRSTLVQRFGGVKDQFVGSGANHQMGFYLALAKTGNDLNAMFIAVDGSLENRLGKYFPFPTRFKNRNGDFHAKVHEKTGIAPGGEGFLAIRGQGVSESGRENRNQSDIRVTVRVENTAAPEPGPSPGGGAASGR